MIPKVVPLSNKQKLETVNGCALERTPVYRRQERNKEEVPPWHCTILICLDPDWKRHWAQPVATPAALLSHFSGGPPGYAIFLSDILGIFYESFLERELFNSFPEEEFLLPQQQVYVETHRTYIKKRKRKEKRKTPFGVSTPVEIIIY